MTRLNFNAARMLTNELQKKLAKFVLNSQAGRIVGNDQAYLCKSYGLSVPSGLYIEIDLQPIDDAEIPPDGCVELPKSEYVGTYGTIPIKYNYQ
ncbi:MAG: hypothetical protein V1738_01710 [Patescibacteria group bacterium]